MTEIHDVHLTTMQVTCTTEGCENEGADLIVTVNADAPVVQCGPCGQWIVPPPEPQEETDG